MWFFVGLVGLWVLGPILLWIAPGRAGYGRCCTECHGRAAVALEPFGAVFAADGPVVGAAGGAARCLAAHGRRIARRQPCPGCCRVADDVEQGRALDETLAARRQFPASLIPVIQWGQQAPALADAFRAAAEMFEGRVRSQGTLMEAMLLPIMFLAILIFVGFFVIAMFMPLFSLITKLSG